MKTLVIKIHIETPENAEEEAEALEQIYKWADENFPSGYTVYKTNGVWEGKTRQSFAIEKYENDLGLAQDEKFIESIKVLGKKLKQKEVLITYFVAESKSIETGYSSDNT